VTNPNIVVPTAPIDAILSVVNPREWTVARVEASARSRSMTTRGRLVAIFEVLDDLVNRADREARAFVSRLARVSAEAPRTADDTELVREFRALIRALAVETNIAEPEALVQSWWILMKGSLLKAMDGDLEAARRAGDMASDLVARLGSSRAEPVHPLMGSDAAIDFEEHYTREP
jgi:hypothetical protein